MKHKSKTCFQYLPFIILDEKQKKFDVENFFQNLTWSLLKFCDQTNNLAETAVGSLIYMNLKMKNFY